MDCRLGRELTSCRYEDARGRPKEVRYWAAEATTGHFEPNHEVDELAWLPPAVATARLTYVRDRLLVPELLAALNPGVGAGPR
jgi:8-oxo-dGTP diphosphatase